MPSVYQLKSAFSDLLRPLTNQLANKGVTANQVTVTAMLGSVLLAGSLYFSTANSLITPLLWLSVPLWMFIRMALNNIDGMLAREHNMSTPQGAILNEMGDVVSDSALFLAFAALPGINIPLLVMLTLLAVMSEMIGVVAVQIGASRRYDGPSGKSDRALFFGVLGLLYALGINPGTWSTLVLLLITVLLVATIVNRAKSALREVNGNTAAEAD
ncbi:CDP-alcohol phosphatidyltransferase family protein [Amphritea pacifica]|uniref:CDP-alcohol phosphatidyltransferase family protein n=1 Tax=Amphritea pacifica TaxID=2811233 RepID=A0ABS2W5Z4_9GAMM|nr:CDP-alcohol phosphatidyltransferase family protein [Amphritea pacifica]MBN0987056.1 CDP-alcohol phosphatidyltransferase family protein [Amphritea pacifica]MBN1006403.1 CDP-alcohol phosphatidyltransferase family protein [Amphritea pacifica]